MADIKIDDTVDITDVVCPVTFVKAKVALEELDDGQILAIKMNDGEPVQNVPRSVKEEGHQILKGRSTVTYRTPLTSCRLSTVVERKWRELSRSRPRVANRGASTTVAVRRRYCEYLSTRVCAR